MQTPEDVAQMLRLKAAGLGIKHIARKLGRPMPADAFAAFVREHGARRAQGHERALTLVIGHASTSPDAPAMAASAAP